MDGWGALQDQEDLKEALLKRKKDTPPPVPPAPPPAPSLGDPPLEDPPRTAAADDKPDTGTNKSDTAEAGAWRRFFARSIDIAILNNVLGYAVGFLGAYFSTEFAFWLQEPGSAQVLMLLVLPISLMTEALIYAIFKTTIGKSILGVRVESLAAQKKASPWQYFKRQWGVYFGGLGLGIPLVTLITMGVQSSNLSKNGSTGYDRGRYRVTARPLTWWRVVLAVVFVGAALSSEVIFRVIDQQYQAAMLRPTPYTNPLTGVDVTMPSGWVREETENDDGDALDMFTHYEGRSIVIFGSEPYDLTLSLEDYADLWASAVTDDMVLYPPGTEEGVAGFRARIVRGHIAGDSDQRLAATIVRRGSMIWRVVALSQGGDEPLTDRAREVRRLLLSTL